MELILNIDKPLGITSYDVIRQLKRKYKGEKIGHAGTLDPLATGVLVCMVGKDATKRQSEFMNISKEYEFDVLFGFETDTYDILGFPKLVNKDKAIKDIENEVKDNISSFKGLIKQTVPPFSAVKINGLPLYRWYLQGKIDEVEVPTREIDVEEIKIIKTIVVTKLDLEKNILKTLEVVRQGFRKEDVIKRWKELLSEEDDNKEYLIVTIRTTVSKGTYIRAIAHDLGKKLGVGGCVTRLVRTKVGKYHLEDAINLESPSL